MPGRRLRVLLSAYACEPGKGSEPGVGWHWAIQAARHHDVWVLTRENNRDVIESAIDPAFEPHLRFQYYDLPAWVRRWKRGALGLRAYYVLWQLGVLGVARRLHREVGFDVVHHVTFNSLDVPGFLWRVGPPFVWGPVGGGQESAVALRAYFGRRWLRERLRTLRKRAARLNPLVRAAVRRSAAILVANEDTARRLPASSSARWVRELETAVVLPGRPSPPRSRDRADPFTVLWVGGLILLKAPRLALDALAELKQRGVAFRANFVGTGELEGAMREWARALGLDAQVSMVGRAPYADMSTWYARSDAFLFTGLHDTSGNVVLEAMSHGLPVVTLDQHGAGEMVDADCGLKVRIVKREQVVADLASSLARLAADPDLSRRLGEAGRRRVEREYTWDRKGDLLRSLYAEVTGAPAPTAGGGSPGPSADAASALTTHPHAPASRP
jgi:glycosyltransferase involved in cell wall biosynthesis